jgi:hypothetical protein
MGANRRGPDLKREYRGKGGAPVQWTLSTVRCTDEDPEGDQGPIDLTAGLETKRTENAAAYLYRRIEASEACTVPVLFGSDDGLRLWLNGELLLDLSFARGLREGEQRLRLSLQPGTNHLLAKVNNGGGAWGFQLAHDAARVAKLRHESAERVDAAIDRGIEYLLSKQYPDGSWSFMTDRYRNGQTALAIYTLLSSGTPSRHDAVRRGIEYLRSRPPTKTYSVGGQLMAFAAARDPALREEIEAMVELLVDWQSEGGFAYPSGSVDLSCAQFAALGLRAAASAGVPVRAKVWDDLVDHVLPYQTEEGGFPYRKGDRVTGSMTAAGLTILGAALEDLRERGTPPRRIRKIEQAMEAGAEWLDRHWAVHENPIPGKPSGGSARWMHYYLYGLERVGAFRRNAHLGPHDWYWDGAQRLLASQGRDGQWSSPYGESEANTCFALLFLQRATATTSGGGERTRMKTFATEEEDAAVMLHATGDLSLTVWITAFGRETIRAHAWPPERGGGVRVRKVEYLVEGEVVRVLRGDPGKPVGFERFAAPLEFTRPGSYRLSVRVTLAKPPPESTDVVVSSPPLRVEIGEVVDEETISYASDSTRSVLAGARFEVSASSRLGGSYPAKRATDQRLATCWLSSNEDEEPYLRLTMKRPVRADTLLLSQALPDARKPTLAARFTRVEVIINRRRKSEVLLDTSDDPGHKTVISFGKPEVVRFLEIRILERVPGDQHGYAVGFAEVELQLRK